MALQSQLAMRRNVRRLLIRMVGIFVVMSPIASSASASTPAHIGKSFRLGPYRIDAAAPLYGVTISNAKEFGVRATGQFDAIKITLTNISKTPQNPLITATASINSGDTFAPNDMADMLANFRSSPSLYLNPGKTQRIWFIFDLPRKARIAHETLLDNLLGLSVRVND